MEVKSVNESMMKSKDSGLYEIIRADNSRHRVWFLDHEKHSGFVRTRRPDSGEEVKASLYALKLLKGNIEYAKEIGLADFSSMSKVNLLIYGFDEDALSEEERMMRGIKVKNTIFINTKSSESMERTVSHGLYHAIKNKEGIDPERLSLEEMVFEEGAAELYSAAYSTREARRSGRGGKLLDALGLDRNSIRKLQTVAEGAAVHGPKKFGQLLPEGLLNEAEEVLRYLTKVEKASGLGMALAGLELFSNNMDCEKSVREMFRSDYAAFARILYHRIAFIKSLRE